MLLVYFGVFWALWFDVSGFGGLVVACFWFWFYLWFFVCFFLMFVIHTNVILLVCFGDFVGFECGCGSLVFGFLYTLVFRGFTVWVSFSFVFSLFGLGIALFGGFWYFGCFRVWFRWVVLWSCRFELGCGLFGFAGWVLCE